MKQSAAKTLGVAALGAAIAAVGAGTADAAPAGPGAAQALDTVTKTLPGENVGRAVPVATQALVQGQGVVGAGLAAVQPSVAKALAEGPTAPAAGLLGGMPVQNTGLPMHGTGVNGIPLG
ncbi:ATP-binding protein [Streptomyces sp. NPDC046727]|uniref:ATP-binding protein n=1 Tax=Streptomyces sp. NPDC046727 TaxID=3155373 RepID=UPI0033FE4AAD